MHPQHNHLPDTGLQQDGGKAVNPAVACSQQEPGWSLQWHAVSKSRGGLLHLSVGYQKLRHLTLCSHLGPGSLQAAARTIDRGHIFRWVGLIPLKGFMAGTERKGETLLM